MTEVLDELLAIEMTTEDDEVLFYFLAGLLARHDDLVTVLKRF